MAITDSRGLLVAIKVGSASPHELTLVDKNLHHGFTRGFPKRLVGDKDYYSDPMDARLKRFRGIEVIPPHRVGVGNQRQHKTAGNFGVIEDNGKSNDSLHAFITTAGLLPAVTIGLISSVNLSS